MITPEGHLLRTRARFALQRWRRTQPRAALQTTRATERVVATPIDHDAAEDVAEWNQSFADYLVAHELFFVEEQSFHICQGHAVAREVIASGVIPAAFACPRANDLCPIAAASRCAGGRELRLSLAARTV